MQFSIIAIFATLVALVYAIPTHDDYIGRALMRRTNCDWAHCSANILPTVVSCLKAAFKPGSDVYDSGACFAAINNNIENLPTDCQGCGEVVEKESNVIINDVENGIDDIPTIADHVWNDIQGWFDKVKNWLKNIF